MGNLLMGNLLMDNIDIEFVKSFFSMLTHIYQYISNMGGSESKVAQLNESITNVTSSVVAKASSTASGSITQSQSVSAVGKDSVVRNVELLQEAKISLSIMQDASMNAAMQAEITNEIMAKIDKAKSDFPQISESKSDSDIKNIIRTNVSNTFSIDAIQSISLSIDQSQEVNAVSGGLVDTVKFAQAADAIGEAINSMSGDITSDLGLGNKSTADTSEKTTFFGADLVNAIGDSINTVVGGFGEALGLDDTTIVVIIIMVIVGYMLASKTLDKQPNMLAMRPPGMQRGPPVGMQRGPPIGMQRGPPVGYQAVRKTGSYSDWGAPPAGI